MERKELVKRLLSLASDIVTGDADRANVKRRLALISGALESPKAEGAAASSATIADGEVVKRIFEAWAKRSGHARAKLSPTRRKKIAARLREGFSEQDIMRAIEGALSSSFHAENGFDDIELICRSAEKVEAFMNKAADAPRGVVAETKRDALVRASKEALKEGRREEYEALQARLTKMGRPRVGE